MSNASDGVTRSLRLALFSYGLPTPGQKRGGIERVAHELADGLARRGHAVTVWTHDPKPEGVAYEVRLLPWRRFVNTWLGRRLTMGYLGNLLALLPDYGRVDALITLGDSVLLPVLGRRFIRVMPGSALGEALHATSAWRFVLQLGVYVQELWCGLTQSGCVGISQNTRGHNPFVWRVIPLGTDLRCFHPADTGKSPQPSVLFVGALGGRKRGRRLLEWFTQGVLPKFPQATLEMVSPPGPQLPGVRYHVGVSNDTLAELYRRSWVYATPSTYEGFGLPYVEAMACGTPVVATPNAGSREVLAEGKYGILAEDSTFSGELIRLLGDAKLREEYSARGLARASDYSLAAMIDQYESLLREQGRSAKRRSNGRCKL